MAPPRRRSREAVLGRRRVADPHTAADLLGDWDRAYPRELGAYPSGVDADKYWTPVSRIDQAYGDRNLVCSCPPVETYA